MGKKGKTSMGSLQDSLLEIENDASVEKEARTSKITSVPEVFGDLSNHSNGKKGKANAIVRALTSVILDQGGDTIPVSYFALLLSSFPDTKEQEELDVLLYLFRLILPVISTSVLTSKFSEISSILQSILSKKYESSLLLVNTLKCIALIMKAAAPTITASPWSKQAKLVRLFHGLLALSIDPRAKVRKEAQRVIHMMYDHESSIAAGKNSSKMLGKFIVSRFASKDKGEDKRKTLSYLFTMLTDIAPYIPQAMLIDLLDGVIAQMKLNSTIIRTQGYVLFASIFSHRPLPLQQVSIAKFIPEIEAIRPQEQDKSSVQFYCEVISTSMIALHSIESIMAANRLPATIKNLMDLVLATKYECYEPIFSAMERMMIHMIDGTLIRTSMNNPQSNLHQIGEELRRGLSFQYKAAWGFVLALYTTFFKQMDHSSAPWMKSSIETIEEFAKDSTARYHSIACQVICTAIRALGPEAFLSVLPLHFDLPLEAAERREWLLPCLQRAIVGSSLQFFGGFFLPLLSSLKENIASAEQESRSMEAKHYLVLYNQVWALFPAFCTFPTDVLENFKNIAKTIGTLMNEEADLRIILCRALFTLITRFQSLLPQKNTIFIDDQEYDEDEDSFTKRKAEEEEEGSDPLPSGNHFISLELAQSSLAEIGKYAKNFLPILFNIFFTIENHSKALKLRASLYNAIKAFASISEEKVLESFFGSLLKKILENPGKTKVERRQKAMLTELCQAFVDSASMEQLELLFKIIKPQLSESDIKVQKKSYQVLERLCCHEEYLLQHLEELKEILIGSLSSSMAAAKKNRLRCLRYVVHALPEDPVEQLFSSKSTIPSSEVLAEIIVCVKELNKDAREEAFNLLLTLSERSHYYYNDPSRFINLVVAGLAGTSPHMISATVQALTRIIHHLRDELSEEYTESLYQTILILFNTKNREIVKSCLGFVKTCCTVLTEEKLRANIKSTIQNIFMWINESKNRFRLKIKLILNKFIFILGYEEIQFFVPPEHHKLLASVRRDMVRNKEKAGKGKSRDAASKGDDAMDDDNDDAADDSDDDMGSDDEFIDQFRSEPGADGMDDDDDDIVDLLDPNASKKNRKQKSETNDDDAFKQDKQGRFVIPDDKVTEDADAPPSKSIHDLVREAGGVIGPTKGKRSRVVDIDDDEGENRVAPPKKKQKVISSHKYTGREYKSSKASGDRKIEGRHEPFAYMAMDPQLLNRRKQQKISKQYKNVVSSAQKGATKGKKMRKKQKQ